MHRSTLVVGAAGAAAAALLTAQLATAGQADAGCLQLDRSDSAPSYQRLVRSITLTEPHPVITDHYKSFRVDLLSRGVVDGRVTASSSDCGDLTYTLEVHAYAGVDAADNVLPGAFLAKQSQAGPSGTRTITIPVVVSHSGADVAARVVVTDRRGTVLKTTNWDSASASGNGFPGGGGNIGWS